LNTVRFGLATDVIISIFVFAYSIRSTVSTAGMIVGVITGSFVRVDDLIWRFGQL
jgi:hypothetical protein